jgi:fibronectin type 3 domain-containing protein
MKKLCLAFLILLTSTLAFAADVTLQWDANTEPDLVGYKVYHGTESRTYGDPIEIPLTELADAANPEYIIHVPDGLFHYITVTAYDLEALESDYSNEVISFDGKPPAKVNGFRKLLREIISWIKHPFKRSLRIS